MHIPLNVNKNISRDPHINQYDHRWNTWSCVEKSQNSSFEDYYYSISSVYEVFGKLLDFFVNYVIL